MANPIAFHAACCDDPGELKHLLKVATQVGTYPKADVGHGGTRQRDPEKQGIYDALQRIHK